MRKFINLISLILFVGLLSCDQYFEPREDNTYDEGIMLSRPQYVEGLLMRVYNDLPSDYNFYTDVATDDAVTNLENSSYSRMATGEWSSSFYPIASWSDAYDDIFLINKFLKLYQSVTWASDQRLTKEENMLRDQLHKERLKGEAYGLRAWYKFQLLQYHAGMTNDGRLLGFPIIDENLDLADNWELTRDTYSDCVSSIMSDLDIAISILPATYEDIGDYAHDDAFGNRFENRMNGNAARALESRVALHAASPAFSSSSNVNWADAATIAGDLLTDLGGLYGDGTEFYKSTDNKEKIWDLSVRQIRSWEQNNFPPSLFGSGRTNPTQNIVNAFPMKNGYPIDHEMSGYDPDIPYANRDPRLSDYIIYNGASLKNATVNTYEGADADGINVIQSSTQTGYYLKKFMSESVNLVPSSTVNAPHAYTLFRETEVHLNFAEAANEAWGPGGDPNSYGFTAKSIIGDLRARAGINDPDDYLASISTKDEMRMLIRNERRLELCFEDFRFWDIRRWNDVNTLQTPAKGVYITFDEANSTYSYRYDNVENRVFDSYMIYGPIPFEETLKYNIEQNKGW